MPGSHLLARERVQTNPLRYYVLLPVARSVDMWVRPRTEMLPLDTRWWEYEDDLQDCVLATLWGVLNLLFLAAAVMGLVRGPRPQLSRLYAAVRAAALGVPRHSGQSRTPLHAGVLSGRAVAGSSLDLRLEETAILEL